MVIRPTLAGWKAGLLCILIEKSFNESGGDMFKLNDHFCQVAFLNKRLVEEFNSISKSIFKGNEY